MNAPLLYNEHNIERWVERQIDILDVKYMLDQISSEEYNNQMQNIKQKADLFYAFGERTKEPYIYEL